MEILFICIMVLILIKPMLFYGSLIPIAIINRILYNKKIGEKKKKKDNIASQSSHSGIVGFVGRSVLTYIRFISLRVGYIPLMFVRKLIYKRVFLMNIADGVSVHYGTEILGADGIIINKNTIIGDKVILDGRNKLEIGENVNIGTEVKIYTQQHNYNSPYFDSYDDDVCRVKIGDYAWLCANCMIMPGCKIGKGAVVGAGAIVTHDVAPFTVVAGVPAKEIGKRSKNQEYELSYSTIHFW